MLECFATGLLLVLVLLLVIEEAWANLVEITETFRTKFRDKDGTVHMHDCCRRASGPRHGRRKAAGEGNSLRADMETESDNTLR